MTRSRRDDLIAAGVVGTVAGVYVLGDRFPTFRLFFGWPYGGTWSNTIASVEWTLIVLFVVWYFRDSLGPRLTGWWHRHRSDHHEEHHTGTRDHVTSELVSLRQYIDQRFDELAELIRGAGGN